MLFPEGANMSTTACFEPPISIRVTDAEPLHISPEPGLSVFVVFTSLDWTLKALEKAREVAKPLGANIVVLAVRVVPFPLPLDEPPVPMEFVIRRFEEKASDLSERTKISAYLCRDPLVALKRILSPNCPVVMCIRRKWWPIHDETLARKLRRAGYDVILVNQE
jgi:hypothetical protein